MAGTSIHRAGDPRVHREALLDELCQALALASDPSARGVAAYGRLEPVLPCPVPTVDGCRSTRRPIASNDSPSIEVSLELASVHMARLCAGGWTEISRGGQFPRSSISSAARVGPSWPADQAATEAVRSR